MAGANHDGVVNRVGACLQSGGDQGSHKAILKLLTLSQRLAKMKLKFIHLSCTLP